MCPACTEKRVHANEDWKLHPYAGHGYASGQGWTHPDLEPALRESDGLAVPGPERGRTDLAQGSQAGAAASLRSGEGGDGTAPAGGVA